MPEQPDAHWPITFRQVAEARRRLRPHLAPTPLRACRPLDEAAGLRLLLKHENHQPTNAFKVRNGLAALTAMSDEERSRGVVSATMGNHGLGLVWAGRRLGVRVTLCVPRCANPDKVAALRALDAEIITEGEDYDEALEVMDRLVAERGLIAVHGVNHPMMPTGAGTITLEILEQACEMGRTIDAMVFAIGGGSQAVGAMTVLRELAPRIEVFGVQAAGAAAMHDAWRAGRPPADAPASPETIADGIATRGVYELTFGALQRRLADFITVTDAQIAEAMRLILRTTHNLVEPAGAAGLAGATRLAERLRGRTVAIVLSGANVDLLTLRRVLNDEI